MAKPETAIGPRLGVNALVDADVAEAIGLLELDSIARGYDTADAMMKDAPVALVDSTPVSSGKYVILVAGDPASVESSVKRGVQVGGSAVLDHLLIPSVHAQVLPAIRTTRSVPQIDALGVIETRGVAAAIRAADAAAKAAAVDLIHVRLAMSIGGKGVITLTGSHPDTIAAVEAGAEAARESGMLLATTVIARPHVATDRTVLG